LKPLKRYKIFGVKSELSQVIISIISNAIDVLKNIENPKIKIIFFQIVLR
jgi:C4-dicarboxylate-specific signal transduction histidine kinase